MSTKFTPASAGHWEKGEWVSGWKISQYLGTGTSSVVESNQRWNTREEAQAAADRANAGNEEGLTFSSFADD